jgi:P-type Mg2+ transporter
VFIATLSVAIVTVILPYTPLGPILGFSRLPVSFSPLIGVVIVAYMVAAVVAKMIFYGEVRL